MYESKLTLKKFVYSYDQYHWWPIDLIVKFVELISSVKYRILIDGIAIKIKMNMGTIVQISSIVWPCNRFRLINLLEVKEIIIYKIIMVIKIIIIIVKSWKKIIIS